MRRLRSLPAALVDAIGERFVPAALTAVGVVLVTAGLLSYLSPAAAQAPPTPPATVSSQSASPTPRPTLPALASPSAAASIDRAARRPTRVVVPALSIDLPVVQPPANQSFPYCNVAEFTAALSRPGLSGATYIYAHARAGMFLPLLEQSIRDPNGLLNMYVQVFTADDHEFLYQISQVRRHQPATPASLADAYNAKTEQLWLQTSEGPNESSTKLMVIATPLGELPPPDHAKANPTAHPVVCG